MLMHPNDAEGIANSVDPDQTAPLAVDLDHVALFAQTCMSKNLGKNTGTSVYKLMNYKKVKLSHGI